MKIYLSADIEGVTGVTHWDETNLEKGVFPAAQKQMTAEVVAACEGALQAGASEILIKDAHDSARNLLAEELPMQARLIRGWSEHPYMMMQEIDESFDAALMIGYHSRSGSGASPLAHTMSGRLTYFKINELYASEFLLNAWTAASRGVPTVFLSGDQGLCDDAARIIPAMRSVAVKQGVGESTINIHPKLAVQRIQAEVKAALSGDLKACLPALPEHFHLELGYKDAGFAYRSSFYPGARLIADQVLAFDTTDFFDVLRVVLFLL